MENDGRFAASLELIKYEGQLIWQAFSVFLLAHSVILGMTLQSVSTASDPFVFRPFVFAAAIVGFILVFPWTAAYLRQHAYYSFRFAQARAREPDGWKLISGPAEDFAAGKSAEVEGKSYQIPLLARTLKTRTSAGLVIVVFTLIYVVLAVTSGPWAHCQGDGPKSQVQSTQSTATSVALPVQGK